MYPCGPTTTWVLKTISRSFSLSPAQRTKRWRLAISSSRRTLGPSGTGSASSHVFGVQWPWMTSSGNKTTSAPAVTAFSHQASMPRRTRSGSPRNPFMLTAATRVVLIDGFLAGIRSTLLLQDRSRGHGRFGFDQLFYQGDDPLFDVVPRTRRDRRHNVMERLGAFHAVLPSSRSHPQPVASQRNLRGP